MSYKRFFVTSLLTLTYFSAAPSRVFATACSVAISPLGIPPQTNNLPVSFTITNTGDASIRQIEITSAFDNEFSFTPQEVSGWEVFTYSQLAEYGGELLAGQSLNLVWNVNTFNSDGLNGNWVVDANDLGEGGQIGCSGDTSAYSSSSVDLASPAISNLSVSILSTTSVRVSWATNEEATSSLDYGTSSGGYGNSSSDAVPKTAHSITLVGLSSGSTYYVRPKSVDGAGNIGYGGEYSFAMPTPNVTISTNTTITVTETIQAPKIAADTRGPSITFDVDSLKSSYEISPQFSGVADDKSKVVKVDYSVDDGKNWLPADSEDLGEARVRFGFRPEIFDDGTYLVRVRASDSAGNSVVTPSKEIVIDRLPPLVGGGIFAFGAFVLSQSSSSKLVMAEEIEYTALVSAVGGPEEIILTVGESYFQMQKLGTDGLWKGTIKLSKPGEFKVTAKSVDGAGNNTLRELGSIYVVSSGKISEIDGQVLEEAKISFYVKDMLTNNWVLWAGEDFGQENPVLSNSLGEYRAFLPAGTYYFVVEKNGYKTLTSKVFDVDKPTVFNQQFTLSKSDNTNFIFRWIAAFGPKNLIDAQIDSVYQESVPVLLNKEAFTFDLPGFGGRIDLHAKRGKPMFVSFVNTWSPSSIEQINILAKLDKQISTLAVFELETLSKVSVFMARGKYDFEFAVDSDGVLVSDYNVSVYPTGMILDRGGIVRKVFSGVVGEDEINQEIMKATLF